MIATRRLPRSAISIWALAWALRPVSSPLSSHIFSHGATKALLFLSASDLSDASDRGRTYPQLRGAGLRNIPAGVTFTIGALSMVGVPLLAGFTSKLLFAEAALDDSMAYTAVTLIALAISTVLNVIYFLRTVITIYTSR